MLSHKVLTRSDVGDVASYYGDGADDYYAKEGEAQVWQGRGAERLGLTGEVDAQRFRELLAGQVDPACPVARSSTRSDSKTRVGIDFTFSAPKSVSILALVGSHTEMIAAHDRAVTRVMQAVEKEARARQKTAGVTREERTGNLIVAKFRHETTREQDPALHTHAVILNLTQRADGAWRALSNDSIIRMTSYLGAQYRGELARELEAKGYQLAYGPNGTFEIASISREQVLAFSRRSAQIEGHLAAQGLSRESASTGQRQLAAMKSRRGKVYDLDRGTLHAQWRERATELGIELGPTAGKAKSRLFQLTRHKRPDAFVEAKRAHDAVLYAIEHISEREAAFTSARLFDVALRHGVEGVRPHAIFTAIRQEVARGGLVEEEPCYAPAADRKAEGAPVRRLVEELEAAGETRASAAKLIDRAIDEGRLVERPARFTTPQAVKRELEILRIEREGRGAVQPLYNQEQAFLRLPHKDLSVGQLQAAVGILSARNRVIGIEGLAGTGKSHMLLAAKQQIEAKGFEMQALAPYGGQVRALRELGVEAKTVAAFLKEKSPRLPASTVLVIDEAAVLPARQMAQLLQRAEAANVRVALIGDRAQTKAIEAGRPFDQLIRAGMETSEMTEIKRQLNPQLKEAVGLAATGKAAEALEKVENVYEIPDAFARRRAIAMTYAALSKEDQDKTLILSGTNEGRRAINKEVREVLGLEGKGSEAVFLVRRDTTQEERRYAKNYEVGDHIQPEKDYPELGLTRGVAYEVRKIGHDDELTVAERGCPARIVPLRQCRELSVYQAVKGELAAGDQVRMTRNDPSLNIANGDRFRVLWVTPNMMEVSNGERRHILSLKAPLHLDYGYTSTAHGSQGLTADRVLYEVESRRATTSLDTFYVALSRARHEAQIFTDDARRLPRALQREPKKYAALDLQIRINEMQRDRQRGRDRGWEMER